MWIIVIISGLDNAAGPECAFAALNTLVVYVAAVLALWLSKDVQRWLVMLEPQAAVVKIAACETW